MRSEPTDLRVRPDLERHQAIPDVAATPGALHRRAFLQKAGIGAAVAGAAWVAPSVVGRDIAFAGASCAVTNTLNWGDFATDLAFSTTDFPAAGGYPSIRLTVTLSPVNGPSPRPENGRIQNDTFGGQSAKYYMLYMAALASTGYNVTFSFTNVATSAPVTVYNLRFPIFDIDRNVGFNNSFQDVVYISGASASGVPVNSTVVTGSGTQASPWVGNGSNAVPDNSANGNVAVTIASASSFTVSYRAGNLTGGAQAIGFGNMFFCR